MRRIPAPIYVLVIIAGLIAFVYAPRPRADDDIRETAFRHLMTHGESAQKRMTYFLSAGDPGRYRDPSDALMSRFAGNRPPVDKVSRSIVDLRHDPTVYARSTGKPGFILFVGGIKWITPWRVHATFGWYLGGTCSAGGTYVMTYSHARWRVGKCLIGWIS